jgi:hypothetical protein
MFWWMWMCGMGSIASVSLGLTIKVRPRAECSPHSSDDTHPQVLISVQLLPDLGDLGAGRLVDAIEFLRPVDRDLDNVFRRVGHVKVLKTDG